MTLKTGHRYRLPSEAEWEYACRVGTTTPFAFGDTILAQIVNYNGDYPYIKRGKDLYREETVDVSTLTIANGFGLYDMHGNVWEWCQDIWHKDYQGAPNDGSAWEKDGDIDLRIARGGSWINQGYNCRAAVRHRHNMSNKESVIGFRVAFSLT